MRRYTWEQTTPVVEWKGKKDGKTPTKGKPGGTKQETRENEKGGPEKMEERFQVKYMTTKQQVNGLSGGGGIRKRKSLHPWGGGLLEKRIIQEFKEHKTKKEGGGEWMAIAAPTKGEKVNRNAKIMI